MRGWVLGVACALGCTGCFIVLEDDRAPRAEPGPVPMGGVFAPLGEDAELRASWTVGGAPATAEACAELGITDVAIVFFDEADVALTRPATVAVALCQAGEFDSAPARIVRHGRYLAVYRAVDASGFEVGESGAFSLTLSPPLARAELAPVDFVAGAAR